MALSSETAFPDLRPPQDVLWITERLEDAGFSTWAVGGAVRDHLAGRPPGDWDLTTAARPGDVQRIFRRTVPIGVDHGTVGVIARSGKMYEVTTFRRDVETFGRRARVAFSDSLAEDLERRDFTINALAWHPLTHELRDPHGGIQDLAAGVLRTVGEPEQRFAEDRLRVLRALRFAGRFDLRIEERTWAAIRASADKLGALSPERIRDELLRVLRGQPRPSTSLRLYAESGVLAALYPELEASRGVPSDEAGVDLWSHLLRTVDAASAARPLVRVAALLHDIGKVNLGADAPDARAAQRHAAVGAAHARELLRRLRGSNSDVDLVTHLIAQHDPVPSPQASDSDVRRWVRRVGREHLNDLFRLLFADCRGGGGRGECQARLRLLHRRVRSQLRTRPPLSIADLAIDGDDLRDLGIPVGPRYARILTELLERVTDEPAANTREHLLRLASELGESD